MVIVRFFFWAGWFVGLMILLPLYLINQGWHELPAVGAGVLCAFAPLFIIGFILDYIAKSRQ